MAGIVSYGAYVPIYRLNREQIAQAWGSGSIGGEKAVANFDEDTITMAVEAGFNCLRGVDRNTIDALFFASTTAPYKEKQSAALIAEALDLKRGIFTVDFAHSLRAATDALRIALDTIKAGSAKRVLVIASECRTGQPSTEYEQSFGDAAAAVLVGDSEVIASVDAGHTHSDEIVDVWRTDKDEFVHTWEDRFIIDHGYKQNITEGVNEVLKKAGLTMAGISKAAIYAFDGRRHVELAKELGLDTKKQLQDAMFNSVGNTGAADALMILVAALEEAKAGDKLLLAGYGDGCDAFILTATPALAKSKAGRGIKVYLNSKMALPNYDRYLRYRGMLTMVARFADESSATISWRDRSWAVSCRGGKCKACGNINFPKQRICMYCRSQDQFEDVRLSERKGKLFTFSKDFRAPSHDPPTILSIINLDEGGRFYAQMTDRDPDKIEVGMPVELTFRKMHTAADIINYYWKCRPVRIP